MNTVKTVLIAVLVFSFTAGISAQEQYQLLPGSFTFSHKKISYLTMEDGKEVKGYIKNIDRKKGLIEEIKLKMENGKVKKIDPADIKHMYLPQSGWDKFSNAVDVAYDAQKWDNEEVDSDIILDGYAYFEKSEVMINKKKKITALMMLLNPHYSKKIKIYLDPFAGETASVGFGGITVLGGWEKSYYVKKGKDTAYRLKMKDYTEQFDVLFKDCPGLKSMNEGNEPKWTKLDLHVYTYTVECN